VLRQSDHEELGNLRLRMQVRAAFLGELLGVLAHPLDVPGGRAHAVGVARLVEWHQVLPQ
jgi:hypothetical protein